MTELQKVYDAFLAKIEEDEWEGWEIEEASEDWRQILDSAIVYFKFPRKDLSITTTSEGEWFVGDLDNSEIQILSTYMKVEWLNRTIMTWENIKPLYNEKDFSQANLIDKFKAMLEREEKKANRLESTYYRAINRKPFDYGRLAKNG